jgi:hypothetical protein
MSISLYVFTISKRATFLEHPRHILSSPKPSLFAMVLSPTCKQAKEN